MIKGLKDYKVYVFDLDGTLYDQPLLRRIMATRLACYYIIHPFRISELFIVMKFRKLKDSFEDNNVSKASEYGIDPIDELICEKVAHSCSKTTETVCEVIKRWIYDNPLDAIYRARDEQLLEEIRSLRAKGKRVVIFSDYPAEDKIRSLQIDVDGIYSSGDDKIGQLKPSPKGLEVIIKEQKVDKSELIMIGDRQEKDGQCAINAGTDYFILPRKIGKRKSLYE